MIAASMVLFVVAMALWALAVLAYRRADRPGDDFSQGAMVLVYGFFAALLTLIAFVIFLLAPTPAHAAEQAATPSLSGIALTEETCGVTSAMLLTARAMSAAGVDRAAAGRAMALMYDLRSVRDEYSERLREEITDIGYRHTEDPQTLAGVWALKCLGLVHGAAGARMGWRF